MSEFEFEDHVTLETWEDIADRPTYHARVDTKKFRSYQVVALYSLKEQGANCGASDCQKSHGKGMLVIYSGKKETNLCEECCQRLIGVSYEHQQQLLKDQGSLRDKKIQLNTFLEQSESIKDKIKELKHVPYGANWLYQSLTRFRKAYPAELLAVLTEMANSQEYGAILDSRAEKKNTASQLEQVEQLQGLGIFNADIKETLIGNILKPLKELEAYTESPDSTRLLARFCKWADTVDDYFALAEKLVDEGRLFFKASNMERLKSIPLSEKNAKLTRSVRWHSDGGVVK